MGRGAAAVVSELAAAGRVDGVLAAGGSGGSSIAAQVMAALPVGLPKLLVSTMASGDVSPYVGAKDVCVMYSVVDVAGVNRISRLVLGNAAAAMAGMALARAGEQAGEQASGDDERPLVAASMFGVTTPAVETARSRLTGLGYEVLVFHATGAGGRALEALAEARLLAGVLDLTTTELADDLVGGVLSAGPDRLTAAGAAGLPQVIAPGALDMVNFGPRDTVPERFADRLLYVHNPTVTLMRTTAEEMAELGARVGRQGSGGHRADGGVLAGPRGQRAGRRRAGVLRRGGRRRLPRRARRRAPRGRPGHAPDRRAHQRPGVRHGDGRPAAPDDPGQELTCGETRLLARLRAKADRGQAIIGAGAGTGLSAKCAEAGGADLIIIYNSGRYRMAGRGSLAGLMPYGDANAIVTEMAAEVLPVVRQTPVLAGVCGTDPVPDHAAVPGRAFRPGIRRRAELPDGRADRRGVPAEPRGNGHGVRPGDRDDPAGRGARAW